MAYSLRNLGGGRFDVLDEAGRRVKAEVSREEAGDFINSPPPSKPSRNEQVEAERDYQRKVAADLAKPFKDELAEIRKVLAKRRDADEVEILAKAIEPMLKAGKQALRRERRSRMIILPAKPAAKAA